MAFPSAPRGSGRAQGDLHIPTKDNIKALLAAARAFDNTGRAEAFVSLLLFGGLRISEPWVAKALVDRILARIGEE